MYKNKSGKKNMTFKLIHIYFFLCVGKKKSQNNLKLFWDLCLNPNNYSMSSPIS